MSNKAVFLDRDGTINVDKGYVHHIEDWEWIPGAIESIAALNHAGYLVIVVTNQAGIARGYYTDKEVAALHEWMNRELVKHGARIDGFYYCPHHPEFSDECKCRKPLPGLLLQAKRDLDVDFANSWLIGDKHSDVQAGLAAGVKPILVMTGYGTEHRLRLFTNTTCALDIREASNVILQYHPLN